MNCSTFEYQIIGDGNKLGGGGKCSGKYELGVGVNWRIGK